LPRSFDALQGILILRDYMIKELWIN